MNNININDLGGNCAAMVRAGVEEELLAGLVSLGAHIRAGELVDPVGAALREAKERLARSEADVQAWGRGRDELAQREREARAAVVLEANPAKRAALQESAREASEKVRQYAGGDGVLRSRIADAKRDVVRLGAALEVLKGMSATRPDTALLDKIMREVK